MVVPPGEKNGKTLALEENGVPLDKTTLLRA